ncbi:MAG: Rieske 2Fe-2S domain-containing protein [Anaerolineae bacterium]|nr:Rieske 2Fe-2S domain-containing protein [Anaerolineae bacterium]
MATATSTKGALVEKTATQQVVVDVAGINRREFLYYIWGASMVMLLGQSSVGLVWFLLPRFREGEYGGEFRFDGSAVPEVNEEPTRIPEGRMWLSNTDEGFMVLFGICTHLGCLPGWSKNNHRFECPCHGSKFQLGGEWIEGPAPRGLDALDFTLVFTDGSTASSNGSRDPIALNGRTIEQIIVNSGKRITGPAHGA